LIHKELHNLLNSLEECFATRINYTTKSQSIIDHVITDLHLYHQHINFNFHLFQRFADHKSIILSINKETNNTQSSIITTTSKVINHKKILDKNLLADLSPPDFDAFLSDIKHIIHNNSYSLRNKACHKPYVNGEVLNLITIRNNYYKLKRKYPHYNYVIEQYKVYRNAVSNEIKAAKKKYLNNFFHVNASDSRKLWSQFKSLLYNSYETKVPIQVISNNGIPVTDSKSIADIFNTFFVDKIRNLISLHKIDDADFHEFHSYEFYDIHSEFSNPACTEDEIALIIDNLSNSKALDAYGLSNYFVKLHKKSLLRNLTSLINNCIRDNVFPDCLKIGIISPIHKSGNKMDVSNYRPITVLPIFSKIFEYVIKRRLEDHLEANKVLSNNQFGYTKHSNTELAVAHILNDVYKSVDIGYATSLTCLDLSSAFDCVMHSILINKLRKLKLSTSFLSLLKSYFQNRLQAVKIGEFLSDLIMLEFGVAQGGVLSGTLFNFFINSINMIDLHSTIHLYCDDTSLVTTAPDPLTLKRHLEEDLLKISLWLKFHFLTANETKTKYLLFHNKRRQEFFHEISLNIKFNGKVIERVEHTRLLGLEIDETLTFSFHIFQMQKKIVSFMFALKRIRSLITEQTAVTLYFAYIHSRLNYMNSIWAVIPKYLMNAIEIIQRKALRIVFCKDRLCSRVELYSERILPVSVQCRLSTAILTFKMINNSAKLNFPIQYANQRHRHATRNAGNIIVPRTATQLGASNFFIRGFLEFNDIPVDIKKYVSLNLFKSHYREHLYIKQLWDDT
jgi:hypothetical protein